MKYFYIFLIATLSCHASTFRRTYDQLMKNPGYVGMSALEIAVDREDFPAMRHFAYQASQENLIQARERLLNKIDIHEININDLKAKYLKATNKADKMSQLTKERNLSRLLNNELNDLNRRIHPQNK